MGLPDIDNIPDSGAVFTIGRSRFADNVASHFFIRKDPVVSVTCGDEHSAVVCQSGRLFVFGSNDWGQLGLGHKNHVSKPSCVKVLKPEKVTHVACGRAHTLVCTGEQKIFACGSDQESQLGRGSHAVGDSSSSPVMVHDCGLDGPKVMQIAAGSHHSLALISDGGVLAWGSNLEGQLGLPGTSGLVNKPTKVHIPEPVKQISAGYYHSAFLTERGNIYVCGEAESGKLGISVDFMTQVAPKQMQLSGPAAFVTCGGHHTLILGEDGNIYCTGSNASGQLGMGSEVTELQTPKILPRGALQGEVIKKIACGESHVAIVTDSGNLFTCGDGRHGKLGLEENENNVHELTLAVKYQELIVTKVSCGGCHTILVGRRRETDNAHTDSQQQDHLAQKKNPLPPLKIPVARQPNENVSPEKPEEISPGIEKNANETNPESTAPSAEITVNGTTDSVNNIEKPKSPKKLSEYLEEANSKAQEKSEDINGKDKAVIENNNEESTMVSSKENIVDADNNVAEKVKEEVKEPEKVASPRSSGSGVSRVMVEERKKSAASNDGREVVEKPSSPPLPVPPPKPPRLKLSSAENSQSSRQGSSSSRLGSARSEEHKAKETESRPEESTQPELPVESKVVEEGEEEKPQSEGGSTEKSAGSEKSRSAKSKAATDETVEADRQNMLEDIEDNSPVEVKTEVAADDVDVVHPITPKTGKISKLFKAKKQEVENGTKTSSATNTKAKSKTCTIL